MTTSSPPGRVSASVNTRPSAGATPKTRKSSEVVWILEICSAPLLPMTLSGGVCTSASASNARARARHSRKFSGWTLTVPSAAERLLAQDDQPVGPWIRQRPEEDGIDEGEDRGVCADAEGERQDRDRAETRALPQGAQREPDILANAVEKREAARVPALLFPRLDRPHLAPGGVAGAGGSHAGGDVFVLEALQVIAQLRVELLLCAAAAAAANEDADEARGPSAWRVAPLSYRQEDSAEEVRRSRGQEIRRRVTRAGAAPAWRPRGSASAPGSRPAG